MAHDGREGDGLMEIVIVPQENCPRCGGGEEFNNRTKIGHEDGTWSWRCYNPTARCGTTTRKRARQRMSPLPKSRLRPTPGLPSGSTRSTLARPSISWAVSK